MPDEYGYAGKASWTPSRTHIYHHPCGEHIPDTAAARMEHWQQCGSSRTRWSFLDWDQVQSRLLNGGMTEFLLACDADALNAALEIAVLTGFRWLPSAQMVEQIALTEDTA